MNRLTGRNEKGDLLLTGDEVYAGHFYEAVSALEDYEDAEEQGLLVRLPCKVGDTVYINASISQKTFETKVIGVSTVFGENYLVTDLGTVNWRVIGEDVFLTKEEAEQALSRKGGD